MADPKLALASKFSAAHRFSNFGAAIVSAKIEGFRGVNAEINFEYPVTALSGFNGCGKSTVVSFCFAATRSWRPPSTRSATTL
ncbi:putative ATPase [Sinorhizobium fredii]|uniref:ATP-binding protein n=1 Tax=Rhizobium fredii TaxID=380 RepID=UPI0035185164